MFKGHSEQVAEESVHVTDSACFLAIAEWSISLHYTFLSLKRICQNPLVLLSWEWAESLWKFSFSV